MCYFSLQKHFGEQLPSSSISKVAVSPTKSTFPFLCCRRVRASQPQPSSGTPSTSGLPLSKYDCRIENIDCAFAAAPSRNMPAHSRSRPGCEGPTTRPLRTLRLSAEFFPLALAACFLRETPVAWLEVKCGQQTLLDRDIGFVKQIPAGGQGTF